MAILAEPDTSSTVVLEAQKLLNRVLLRGRVRETGALDRGTIAALREFQTEFGLRPPNGVLDDRLMAILRGAANADVPKCQIVVDGKTYLLTEGNYRQLVNRTKEELHRVMQQLDFAIGWARNQWDYMKKLDDDHYIVSYWVDVYTKSRLPSESLINSAERTFGACQKALDSGNLADFGPLFRDAQKQCNIARSAIKKYTAEVIDGAGSITTGLQLIGDTTFVVVGALATPVVASLGAGALVAGVVAGGGVSAVESLSTQVGKGIAGSSKGIGDAALTVLCDTLIGGAVGLVLKGKAGEKLLAKISAAVAKRLGGEIFKKASEKAVVGWLIAYFKKNGADILERVMEDTLKAYKSNAHRLTVDKFCDIVVEDVVTEGIFSRLGKASQIDARETLEHLSISVKKGLMKSLGKDAKESELRKIFGDALAKTRKLWAGKVYDAVLEKWNGTEELRTLERDIVVEAATNSILI